MSAELTPREIVKRSLNFQGVPRVPFRLPQPWHNDVRGVGYAAPKNRQTQPWTPNGEFTEMIDVWGNTWRRLGNFTKGEVAHGAVQDDWALLDSYEWPDVTPPELWVETKTKCEAFHAEGYYVNGGVSWPFNIARKMRRLDNFLCDIMLDRDRVVELLNGVADVVEKEIIGYAEAGVDGIATAEDWGTQDRLLVSPATWREVFKPLFKRLCDVAHDRGLDVWLHSCGHVTEVMDDWAEVGINVCLFDQPELHGIEYLAERYGDKLTICSPVDIQRTLQTRDKAQIEAAAKEYIEVLGAGGGGFIPQYYGDNVALGLDPSVQDIANRAFTRFGDPDNLLGLPEDLR